MTVIGQEITLKAISKHGKDRIHQFGARWIVRAIVSGVAFDFRPGPWLGITDAVGKNDFRWIKENEDKDFIVI